jgi:iron complex outermembrane recepter protein
MSRNYKGGALRLSTALLTACLGLVPMSVAFADEAPAATTEADKSAPLAEVVVTGSAIRTQLDQVVVPVSVLNSETLAKSGVNTNVLDLVRQSIPLVEGRSAIGASNASNTNQITGGGSSINLRNLDTLVLVNGRRVANDAIYAIAGPNARVFVNVNEIPPGAIERIEVLTDGASAIYGSDAIGGVVNIILKSDYEGGQVDARGGFADGGYSEKSASGVYGFSPFHGTNVTVSGSYSNSTALRQNQRTFASPFYSTATAVPGSIGSYFLNPGITAPTPANAAAIAANPQYTNAGATVGTAPGTGIGGTYDLSKYNMLLMPQQQRAAALNWVSQLTENGSVTLFGDAEISHNTALIQFGPVVQGVSVNAGTAFDPLTTNASVNFGDTAAPKQWSTSETAERLTVGLKGKLPQYGNLNWEFAYTHSENQVDLTINNVLALNNLKLAVQGGYNSSGVATPGGTYSQVCPLNQLFTCTAGTASILQPALNPFGLATAITPGALANVLTSEHLTTKSQIDAWDGKVTGNIFELPAGRPAYAIGAALRRDSVSGRPEANGWVHTTGDLTGSLQSLYSGGQLSDPYRASRTVTAQFAELKIPVTSAQWNFPGFHALDVIIAGRHEHYSDFGSSSVPKVGLRWEPIDRQFAIRGNYAESYTAPTLAQLHAPPNISGAASTVFTNNINGALAASADQVGGGNSNLKPALSYSRSLGLLFKPDLIKGLKFDLEYSDITEKGAIGGIGLNNILISVNSLGAASPFFHNVSINAYPGASGATYFSNPGDLSAYLSNPANVSNGMFSTNGSTPNLHLKDVPTNLGNIYVKSFTLNTTYNWTTEHYGEFAFNSMVAYLDSFRAQALPILPVFQFAGTTTQGGGAQGTLPRWKAINSIDWTEGHWNGGLAFTYVSSVRDIGTGGVSYFGAPPLYNIGLSSPSPVTVAQFAAGHVPAYTQWDLRLTYNSSLESGKGWRATVGVNNLFDTLPPVSTNINPAGGHAAGATAWRAENNTDLSAYGGGIGRLTYIALSTRF